MLVRSTPSNLVYAGLQLIVVAVLTTSGVNCAVAESRGEIPAKIMGFINVRDFGAVGDGKTDDTAAIQAAIAGLPNFTRTNPFGIKPIYFPNGIYLVSGTLKRVEADGRYSPGLAFIGESEAGVTLRLKDAAPGFEDPGHPKPLLYFASGLLGKDPNAGGKDYLGLGEGNDAYQNYIEMMTIDTGHNNPGAIGADYLASNIGAIRSVRFVATDGNGKTGIVLTRKWIGPALIKDVSIDGFGVGIDIANTEYSIALDGIRISKSREYGIRNTSNSVSFSNVRISTLNGVGIANVTPQALLVGRDARIEGTNEQAISNQGYMNLTGVAGASSTSGSGSRPETMDETNKLDGVYGPSGKIGNPGWQLPVKAAPQPTQYTTKDWADVLKFGAVADFPR